MISTGKHKKHADLKRPNFGEYARHEYAFIGAPCGSIQELSKTVLAHLADDWKVGYVDADHASGDEKPEAPFAGAFELTDKIAYRQLNLNSDPGLYERRGIFNEYDLVLINGNHFRGKRQIVYIDERKKDSLHRKLERLTDVALILTVGGASIYDFLNEKVDSDTPIIPVENTEAILKWFDHQMASRVAPLYGLALAGGRSMRLGHDKTVIDYHGAPQREVLHNALSKRLEKAFISCRPDQLDELSDPNLALPDRFHDLGPFGGILTAFQAEPDAAWLVVATDLPFAMDEAIDTLIAHRDPSKTATTFHNKTTNFPDPLATIWEPKAFPIMFRLLSQGYSCARKVLINADIKELDPDDPNWLHNVNTPEDLNKARDLAGVNRQS